MRTSFVLFLLLAALFCSTVLYGQAMPRMTGVDPGNGKIGDILSVTGENLEKTNVEQVFLTDGKNDLKMEIVDQAATAVKIKIPANAKPGRFALMILTKGKEPKLIEQPVKVTVE